MTKFGFLLILLLSKALAEEQPNPVFRAVGGELELGYCFAVDYILLYKQTVGTEGKQLLGNSSNAADVSPEAYRGRIHPTHILDELLGMQVVDLAVSDSGVYIRECWKDNELVNHHDHYLYVCDEEVSSEQILSDSDAGTDLVCTANYSEWKHTTIRWYKETNHGSTTSLFLDTKTSLEPLLEEMQGVLQVRDEGSSLHISEIGLKNIHHFTCLIMEGEQCKSFHDIQLPDSNGIDIQPVYYSVGEKAVLTCLSEHLNARLIYWTTPLGRVNSTTKSTSEIYISMNEDTGDYSLVIPSITFNHSGEYKCFTNLAEYFITVCSELVSDKIRVYEGNKVTLGCTSPTEEPTNIQWYRQTEDEFEELIYDSGDPSINLSANFHIEDTSLTITEITLEHSGIYWCIVLLDNSYEYIEENFVDFPEGEGENSNDSNNDDYNWLDGEENTDKCFLKQVIQLKVQSSLFTTKSPRYWNTLPTSDSTLEPVVKSNTVQSESKLESEPGPTQYAVIGGVVGTLLVIVIVIVIVIVLIKLKAKRKATDQMHAECFAPPKEAAVSQPLIHLKEIKP